MLTREVKTVKNRKQGDEGVKETEDSWKEMGERKIKILERPKLCLRCNEPVIMVWAN